MKCAVIGSPIAHSLSPVLHRAAYAELGLDWEYDRREVTAAEVRDFIEGLDRTWRGLSVTMPCKRAIVPLGEPDPVVAALGVGNTLIFDGQPGDRAATRVHNTDVTGIQLVLGALDPAARIVVYGNGATARSCVYALAGLGVGRVAVRARDAAKTVGLAADGAAWGIAVAPADSTDDAEVVISTVPAPVAAAWGPGAARLVFDVLYDPWPTPLAVQAAGQGATVATGLDLLAAQAVGQVELMTGQHVEYAHLRAVLDAARSDPASGG